MLFLWRLVICNLTILDGPLRLFCLDVYYCGTVITTDDVRGGTSDGYLALFFKGRAPYDKVYL